MVHILQGTANWNIAGFQADNTVYDANDPCHGQLMGSGCASNFSPRFLICYSVRTTLARYDKNYWGYSFLR